MIAINNRASSSAGAELLRIPPWMKEAAMVVDDDDDGLLSGSSDERRALGWARYRSFCFVFRGFYDFFTIFIAAFTSLALFSCIFASGSNGE